MERTSEMEGKWTTFGSLFSGVVVSLLLLGSSVYWNSGPKSEKKQASSPKVRDQKKPLPFFLLNSLRERAWVREELERTKTSNFCKNSSVRSDGEEEVAIVTLLLSSWTRGIAESMIYGYRGRDEIRLIKF